MVPMGEVESYRPSDRWIGIGKGGLLAIANVVIIALGIAVASRHDRLFDRMFVTVLVFGGVPALVLGGLLGLLASVFATRSRRWRAVLIALPAFGLVAALGTRYQLIVVIPFACIPTLVAALVLERWTRWAAPVATARSLRA